MHQNAGFRIKNIEKKSGGRDPRTSRGTMGDLFAPTLVLTCQMLVPSASSRLATALAMTTR